MYAIRSYYVSKLEALEPKCSGAGGSVSVLIRANSRDLGGFTVRRLLPSARARRVGPFVFFDA